MEVRKSGKSRSREGEWCKVKRNKGSEAKTHLGSLTVRETKLGNRSRMVAVNE